MIRLISRSKSLEDLAPAAKNGDLDIEDRTFENAIDVYKRQELIDRIAEKLEQVSDDNEFL